MSYQTNRGSVFLEDARILAVEAHAAAKIPGSAVRRVGKGRVDRAAACLIAEQWMNEQ